MVLLLQSHLSLSLETNDTAIQGQILTQRGTVWHRQDTEFRAASGTNPNYCTLAHTAQSHARIKPVVVVVAWRGDHTHRLWLSTLADGRRTTDGANREPVPCRSPLPCIYAPALYIAGALFLRLYVRVCACVRARRGGELARRPNRARQGNKIERDGQKRWEGTTSLARGVGGYLIVSKI